MSQTVQRCVWNFAGPGAANFHGAGPRRDALEVGRAQRGKLPGRGAVPRRAWDFAASAPGKRDALPGHTGACLPSPRCVSSAQPDVTKQYGTATHPASRVCVAQARTGGGGAWKQRRLFAGKHMWARMLWPPTGI